MAAKIKASIGSAATIVNGKTTQGKRFVITAEGEANVKLVNDLLAFGTIPAQAIEDYCKTHKLPYTEL